MNIDDITEEQRMLNEADCATWGHEYDVLNVSGHPIGLSCKRCTKTWPIADEDYEPGEIPELTPSTVVKFRHNGKVIETRLVATNSDGRHVSIELHGELYGDRPEYDEVQDGLGRVLRIYKNGRIEEQPS